MTAMPVSQPDPADEVVEHLRALLRLDTRNPPGNENLAADYIRGVLEREKIEHTTVGPSPDRATIVARLRGDGSERPLLLMSHTDVVAVETDKWTQDPFGGEIIDGFIYGRGALDMKNMVAMELMCMLLLKRRGVKLKRDVIFMAAADEETGGTEGAGWVVDNRPDLIEAEYALNEGGGSVKVVNGIHYYQVQTAEKGVHRFKLRMSGRPGHGSIPHDDNAIVKLAEKLALLRGRRLPHHVSETARAFVAGIAEGQSEPLRGQFLALLDAQRFDATLAVMELEASFKRQLHAMLHNTVSPTILSGGTQINVIPSEVEAKLDGRIVPGQTRELFTRELHELFGDDAQIEFVRPPDKMPVPEAPARGPLWEAITQVLAERAPAARVVPRMLTGATDATHVARLGTTIYGFCPELYTGPDEASRVHGHDERTSVESMRWGVVTLYEVVERFCKR
jgi:acetylornithine deacetylase/succinyl-diaminopimelate desuccinylase-like protein